MGRYWNISADSCNGPALFAVPSPIELAHTTDLIHAKGLFIQDIY
jgi:hypothetical protein